MKIRYFLTTCLLTTGLAVGAELAKPPVQQKFIAIGTGGVTGVYYPTGGAICRLVNKGHQDHGIRCKAESTGGSIYNINSVRAGELEFGVAQSDWQYHAYNGTYQFADQGRFDKERAIFSVHAEPFTVLARRDAGVQSFQDLKGKRVNVGNLGSGVRATTEVVMAAYGMTMDDFSMASELKGSEMGQALCDDKIDVMIHTVGHPAAAITEVTTHCDVEFVEVSGPVIDRLIAENPYYRAASIPGGLYLDQEEDTPTFGVGATLISSADVSKEIVYALVKAVFDNFSDFRRLHPAFAKLTEAVMIKDGLSAPLHEGAVKYYKERGWM